MVTTAIIRLSFNGLLLFLLVLVSGCALTPPPLKLLHSAYIYTTYINPKYPECNFYKIDSIAVRAPAEIAKNINALSEYLIKPAHNEWEKTRIIFVWIARHIAYDAKSYFSHQSTDISTENVLLSGKSVCAGYSGLFKTLGTMAGLEVESISGYSKGYGYSSGDTFTEENHDWNAVKIQGEWHCFDVTWGAGYIDDKKNFKKKFDEFWFNTPPDQLIVSHFPSDSGWQLLENKMSFKDFQQLPEIDHELFEMGFSAQEIRDTVQNNFSGFPKMYDYYHVQIQKLSLPLRKELDAKQKYLFSFTSRELTKAALINNGTFVYFKKAGNKYTLAYKPRHGTLKFSILPTRFNDDDFYGVLEYTVN